MITKKIIVPKCDFCKKKFSKIICDFKGYGMMDITFGYGSKYDGDVFSANICDGCLEKTFSRALKKQLKEKGYKIK